MNTRYILYGLIGLFICTTPACSLIDVTDVAPPYQLSEETVITDIESAEKVLTGAYAQLHDFSLIVDEPAIKGSMGLSFEIGSFGSASYEEFFNNSVQSNNYLLSGIYTQWYYLINISSHIIEKTTVLETQVPRKQEIIAEASFLRSLAHFSLLRLFGQFYDTSSRYGIVSWDHPVKDVSVKPRSTVAETYALIESDLKIAMEHAPEYTSAKYASRQAATMLLAKSCLYKQDYAEAAELIRNLLDRPGAVRLEAEFGSIFSEWFNSEEVLLAPPFDDSNERNNKAFAFRAYVLPTASYRELMGDDPRRDTTVYFTEDGKALRNGKFRNTSANGQSLTANTEYYLRLAEAYLIGAEALIRSGDNAAQREQAREMINVVRTRAGAELIPAGVADKASLLQAVLKEKQLELGCESGEEWFDLVRFTVEGDIDIQSFKPNVKSTTQYILPIPLETIQASGEVVKQNPGYE